MTNEFWIKYILHPVGAGETVKGEFKVKPITTVADIRELVRVKGERSYHGKPFFIFNIELVKKIGGMEQ